MDWSLEAGLGKTHLPMGEEKPMGLPRTRESMLLVKS